MKQPKSPIMNLKPSTTGRLCITLRAFTTTPIESLFIEANKPFSLRRLSLYFNTIPKSSHTPQKPVYNCIMAIKYKNLIENKAKTIKLLNLKIQHLFNEI